MIVERANEIVKRYAINRLKHSVRDIQRQRGRIRKGEDTYLQTRGVVNRANSWTYFIDPTIDPPFIHRNGRIISNYSERDSKGKGSG